MKKKSKSKRIEIVSNKDNESLGPIGGDGKLIGWIPEICGEDAREVPEFVPTRHELYQLIKYWAKKDLAVEFERVIYGSTGSYGIRIGLYAIRRIDRIYSLVDKDKAREAYAEAKKELAEQNDPRLWDLYANGCAEEQLAWKDVFSDMFDVENSEELERFLTGFFDSESYRRARDQRTDDEMKD